MSFSFGGIIQRRESPVAVVWAVLKLDRRLHEIKSGSHIALYSSLSIDECSQQLAANIAHYKPLLNLLFSYLTVQEVIGSISSNQFWLRKSNTGFAEMVTFTGRFQPATDGTLIEGRFVLRDHSVRELSLWSSLLIVAAILYTLLLAAGQLAGHWHFEPRYLLGYMGLGLYFLLFRFTQRNHQAFLVSTPEFLVGFLEDTLQAQEIDQVPFSRGDLY